jgi:hypothetical protein
MRGHAIAAHDFDEIAIGKDLPLFIGQGEKPMQCPLKMPRCDRRGRGNHREGQNQHRGTLPASNS